MNVQIYEEATEWLIENRNGHLGVEKKGAFDIWLRQSPQHVRAYLEISSVWEDVPGLHPGWNPSADELIARARADTNIVALSEPSLRSEPAGEIKRKKRLWYALAASILIMLAMVPWWFSEHGSFRAGIGEQRSLRLADGSTVELNTRSRIKVQYSKHQRHIVLLEGQALFHVIKSATRPFIVQVGGTRVRAVGTSFDVYKTPSGTRVTVIEGRVAVRTQQPAVLASRATAKEIFLDVGEQTLVTPAAVSPPKRANVAAATAWTQGNLVFDAAPLTEVAEEFNRYNARALRIDSPELAKFHVSGVFSSADPTLLIRFLHAQSELAVEESDTEIRIKKK